MHLARFPRVNLAHLPTPLEYLPRLSLELGGPNIYIKRDDCTGLASGGNKTRKLEFLMAEARDRGADTVVTEGAVQSNHARQTAAAAARLNLRCELLLENRLTEVSDEYKASGNVLLDRLFDACIHYYPAGEDMPAAMEEHALQLRDQGRVPYLIPGGGSNPVGALGYVNCALELLHQANEQQVKIDHIVHASGSCGTQAGLITGLRAMHTDIPVLGIGVCMVTSWSEEVVQAIFGLPKHIRPEVLVAVGIPVADPPKAPKRFLPIVHHNGFGRPWEGSA